MYIDEINRWSKYMYASKTGVYFNFLSGQMIWDVDNKLLESDSNLLKEKFIEKGFIVNKDFDEKKIASLKVNKIKFDSTLRLTIYPTEKCNFRCSYCYEEFKNISMDEMAEEAVILFIKKNIKRYSALEVTWFGGEPLLEIDRIERLSKRMMDICGKTSRMFRASCITNGYLLNLENLERLMKCHIYSYMVTLDGPAPYHNTTRKKADGSGTFDVIYRNLKDIYLSASSRLLRVKIRVNVSKESKDLLADYVEYLEREFGDNKAFSFMFRPVGNWKLDENRNNEEAINSGDIYRIISETKVRLNCIDHYYELCDSICEASKANGFIIRPNLEVCKCNLLIGNKINTIGNIDWAGNISIDENKVADWIITEKKEECYGCFMECACGGGEMCVAKRKTGIDFEEHLCGYNKGSLDDILEMLCSTGTIEYVPCEILKEE